MYSVASCLQCIMRCESEAVCRDGPKVRFYYSTKAGCLAIITELRTSTEYLVQLRPNVVSAEQNEDTK